MVVLKLFELAPRYAYVQGPLFYYRERPGSIMHSKKNAQFYLREIKPFLDYLNHHPEPTLIRDFASLECFRKIWRYARYTFLNGRDSREAAAYFAAYNKVKSADASLWRKTDLKHYKALSAKNYFWLKLKFRLKSRLS